jgi:hypothetical protein
LVYENVFSVANEGFSMFIGLGVAIAALIGAWFIAPKLGVDARARIALSALSAGLVCATTAGFMVSNLAGICVIAAGFLSTAILFGYERG